MKRLAWLGLLALATCASPVTPPPATVSIATPKLCRIGPDGARPVADRGIGGTGAPAVQTADRGIGGTGIIGVITGFASVCVAGEEVSLPASVPAQVDGKPGSSDDLRAGQVIAMQASGPAGSLLAREIVVRHVVIGPVQAAGDGTLTVAGQAVLVGDAAGSATYAPPGQFVAVSGFRQPSGLIVATRIDPAAPGPVLLRGDLVRIYGSTQIGAQIISLPNGSTIPAGFPVVVTGTIRDGVLVADSIARDIAAESPVAYFGPTVSNFVIEGYLSAAAGGYFVSRDFIRGGGYQNEARGRAIAAFTRRPDGGLIGRDQRPGSSGDSSGGGRQFGPAPLGNAGFGQQQGQGGAGNGGPFDQDRGQGFPTSRFPSSGLPGFGGGPTSAPPALPQRH